MLTLNEAAQNMNVSKRTVYRWVRKNYLKGIKLVGSWRIDEKDLESFKQQQSQK